MAKIHGLVGAFYQARQRCLYFDGVAPFNDRVDVVDNDLIDFGAAQSFSISMWLRAPANAGAQVILHKDYTGATGYGLVLDIAGTLTLWVGSGGPEWTVTSGGVVDNNAWHFVVAQRDGATGQLWLYIDGVADPAGGAGGTALILANVANLVFGNTIGGGSNTEQLYIGETHIYDTLLTAAEILALYNGGNGIWSEGGANTRALWHFREGSGATIHDIRPNATAANNGIIAGPTWVSHGITLAGQATGGGPWPAPRTTTHHNLDAVTVYDGATMLTHNQYYVTPYGRIYLVAAPAGVVTADYTHYIVSQCGGFHQWTFAAEADEFDVTDFTTTGWTEWILGNRKWTATAERYWIHPGFDYDLGNRMIVKFFTDEANNRRIEGWGLLKGIGPNCPVNEVVNDSVSFRGDGNFEYEHS